MPLYVTKKTPRLSATWCLLMDLWSGWVSSTPCHVQLHAARAETQPDSHHQLSASRAGWPSCTQHLQTCSPKLAATRCACKWRKATCLLLVKEPHYFTRTLSNQIKLKCIFRSRKMLTEEKSHTHSLFKTNILHPLNDSFQILKRFEICAQCILEMIIY